MSDDPAISPMTLTHPWTTTMIVEVLFENPSFLYINPNVNP